MFIVIILWIGGGEDNSSPAIHKAKKGGPQSTKRIGHRHKRGLILGIKWISPQDARGSIPRLQGDGFATELGGIMELAMWLCAPLLIGL